jgi:hypothetical protein
MLRRCDEYAVDLGERAVERNVERMSVQSGELDGRERQGKGRVVDSRRSLALLAVVVAAGLGAGLAIGSLVKGDGQRDRSPSATAAGVSAQGKAILAVPTLHAIATAPALRSKPKRRSTSENTGGQSSVQGAATGTIAPSTPSTSSVSSSSPALSPPRPRLTSPSPSAPSHGEGSEVHHESGGGA